MTSKPTAMAVRKRRGHSRRSRKRVVLVVLLSVGGFLAIALILRAVSRLLQLADIGGIRHYQPLPNYRAARSTYPFSVVSGGLVSPEEMRDSVKQDAVVAKHYAGIDPDRMHLERLNAAVLVHISYRVGDRVYWTQKKEVPKGELILTDGTHMIRARCGNRLSFVPPERGIAPPPIARRADKAPPEVPVEPPELVLEYGLPAIVPSPGMEPEAPPVIAANPSSPPGRFWPPATTAPLWCCTGYYGFPTSQSTTPVNKRPAHGTRPTRPLAPTPEPSTLLLLATGISAAKFALRKVRRGRSCLVSVPTARKRQRLGSAHTGPQALL